MKLKLLLVLAIFGSVFLHNPFCWGEEGEGGEDGEGGEGESQPAQNNAPEDKCKDSNDPCCKSSDPCCEACKDANSTSCCECKANQQGSATGSSSGNSAPGTGGGIVKCLQLRIYAGQSSYAGSLQSGSFKLEVEQPTEMMFTPSALSYTFNNRIESVSVAQDQTRKVVLVDRQGTAIVFKFGSRSSFGDPIAPHQFSKARMQMVNEAGAPVAEDPIYYELVDKTGYRERFIANMSSPDAGSLVSVISANGRRQSLIENGIEVIRSEGIMRQVKTPQCLADIQTQTPSGYTIRFFSPENVPARGTNDVYDPLGEPYMLWTVEQPDLNTIDRIRITQTGLDITNTYEYTYSAYLHKWTLITGEGQRKESQWTLTSDDGQTEIKVREIRNGADEIVSKTETEVRNLPWVKLEDRFTEDPEGAALTTLYTYYMDESDGAKRGLTKTQVNPDGSWVKYDYDDLGREVIRLEPMGDLSQEEASVENACTTLTSYDPVDEADKPVIISNVWYSTAYFTTNIPYWPGERLSGQVTIKYYKPSPISISDATFVRDYCEDEVFAALGHTPMCSMLYQRVLTHYTLKTNDFRPRSVTKKHAGTMVERVFYAYKHASDGSPVEVTEKASSSISLYGHTNNLRTTKVFYPSTNDILTAGLLHYVEHPDGRRDTHLYERGAYVREGNDAGVFTLGAGPYIRQTIVHGLASAPDGVAYKTTKEETILNEAEQIVCKAEYVYTGTGYEMSGWRVDQYDSINRRTNTLYSSGLKEATAWMGYKKALETDKNGVTTAFYYDALQREQLRIKLGVPSAGEFPAQPDLATLYAYDAAGRLLSSTLSGGDLSVETRHEYDRAGRKTKTVDQAGLETTYQYEEGGRIETTSYPNGAQMRTEKYLDGRIKSVSGSAVLGSFYEYGVNEDGSQWTRTFQGGTNSPLWTKTTRDVLGRTVRQETPSTLSQYQYDAKGRMVRQESTGAAVAMFEYDEMGRQIRSGSDLDGNGLLDLASDRITDTEQQYVFAEDAWWKETTRKTYPTDGSSQAVTLRMDREAIGGAGCSCKANEFLSIDLHSNVTRMASSLNAENNLLVTTITDSLSTNPAVEITHNGLLVSRTSKTGVETRFLYDAIGRQMAVVDARTGANSMQYDARGWVDYTEDAAGNRTTFTYDPDTGRRIATTDALSNTTHTAYDLQGRVIATWGATYPVAYEYDDFGRMNAMYTYRGNNSLSSQSQIENCKSQMDRTTWSYDLSSGLLTNKLYADGKGTAYTYDNAGRLASRTWARGVVTTYGYDLAGSLTNISYSDSTPSVAFTYDRLGRQVTITDILGTRTNAYDPATLALAEEQLPDGTTLYRTLDTHGRPSGLSLGNYSVSYGYDPVGRFSLVSASVDSVPYVANYSYLPSSDLLAGYVLTPGGSAASLAVTRVYEPDRNLISSIQNRFNGSVISSFDYENDAIGRRTKRVDTASTTNAFGYNIRSELVEAVMGTNNLAYQYDPIGNREWTRMNANTNFYIANELNQYLSISNRPSAIENRPFYDDDGNMLTYNGWTFTWDGENRLIMASNGTTVVENTYDYMSRRVRKTVGSTSTTFLYDGWLLVSEQSASGGNLTTNLYVWGLDLSGTFQGAGGIGGLMLTHTFDTNDLSAKLAFVLADANGNVTDLVFTNGTIAAHYEYDPYGNVIKADGPEVWNNPYRFSTKYQDDETGFLYYGYRFYSPEMGRWVNRDPIGERGGINVKAFARNNALFWVDPFGLKIIIDPGAPPEFQEKVNDCLDQLKKGPCGKALFDKVDKEDDVFITPCEGGEGCPGTGSRRPNGPFSGTVPGCEIGLYPADPIFIPPGSDLHDKYKDEKPYFDPDDPESVNKACAVVLGHELGHAMGLKHPDQPGLPDDVVNQIENPIRDEQGIPRRESYHGCPINPIPETPRSL